MATIEENRRHWSAYDWSHEGEEWSAAWGGSRALWLSTLWPRLNSFLPASRVLEIAPGYGRITEFLVPLSRRLDLVDLTERCIESCQQRFRAHRHLGYHVNDGRSLGFLADCSVDFAISFDSLVHAELEAIEGYVRELARVLRPGGAAFLHHSNLADAVRDAGRELENPHWRGATVGADAVAAAAHAARIDCVLQERLAWGGEILNDCFTVVVRRESRDRPARRENREFMREAELARATAALYRSSAAPPAAGVRSARPSLLKRLLGREDDRR